MLSKKGDALCTSSIVSRTVGTPLYIANRGLTNHNSWASYPLSRGRHTGHHGKQTIRRLRRTSLSSKWKLECPQSI
jgi:hypothetical protein